jgi:hypothetical protein
MIETKAFRTFIKNYFLFKSERLSGNSKLIIHETLIRSVMTYPFYAWEFVAGTSNCSALKSKGSPLHLKLSKLHAGPWFAHGF